MLGLEGISITTKLIAAVVALTLIASAAAWGVHAIRDAAVQADRQRAKEAFDQLEGKANVGSKDVRNCAITGGTWDRASGLCIEPSSDK